MVSQNLTVVRYASIGLSLAVLCGLFVFSALNSAPARAQSDSPERQMKTLKAEIERPGPVSPATAKRYESLAALLSDCSPTGEILKTFRADDPLAPQSDLCLAGGSLTAADPNYNRVVFSGTGTGIGTGTVGSCSLSGSGTAVNHDVYSFNLTGCAVFPTEVTMTLCGPGGCQHAGNPDTTMVLYRNVSSGDPLAGNGGLPGVFNPAAACTNARGANDDLNTTVGPENNPGGASCNQVTPASCVAPCTSPSNADSLSGMKRQLGSGRFTLVIGGFGNATIGNYNLYVNAPAAGCAVALASTANCISAPSGLVSWWAGNGNSFDYQGGNQGALNGNTSYATGKVQEAFNFDGDGDYVSVTENGSLDLQNNNFSIDTWVYLRSSKLHYIAGKNDCLTNSYTLTVNELNKVVFSVLSSTGDETLESTAPITLNGWHHVAGVKDGSTLHLYVDGVLSASRPLNGTLASNDALFTIGGQPSDLFCNSAQPSGTDGLIDEIDVFNRALTLAEIQSIYNSGGEGKCQPASFLSFNPNPVVAGNVSTGTFTLSIPAPAGGANVTLVSSDSSVATVPASITIAGGQTSGTFTVTTPPRESDTFVNIEGTYNGLSRSTTLSVLRSRPDLQITSATAPSEVSTASPFDITWTDFNGGIVDAQGSWTDEVFFSTNSLLDGADRTLGRFTFTGPLAPGQSESITNNVTIPLSAVAANGNYFLIIRADTFNSVNEGGFENNNLIVRPIQVIRRAPDLQISDPVVPVEINTGAPFNVSWTDRNMGDASAGPNWNDQVYFSTDNQVGADTLLGNLGVATTLAPNGSIDRSIANLVVPFSAITSTGDYFIYIRTDSGNVIDEGSNENNNIVFRSVRVNRIAPDLQISDPVVPAEINTGAPFNVSWTDRNAGDASAGPNWNDQVYFSTDNQVGADILLGNLGVTTTLAPNGSIDRSIANLIVPFSAITSTGDYFIYIRTDSGNVINEGSNENNNIVFRSAHVNRVAPDLQVPLVTMLPEVETSQEFEVSWTLTNSGTARAIPTWTDCVYFSSDNQPGSDTSLGCFSFSQGLDPNQTVERIQNVTIPLSIIAQTGNYYIFVQTDINDTVDEGTAGNNNNRSAFRPLRVRRTLRPDLTVPAIVAPDTAFFDQDIQVQWTVTNNGPGSTNASQWSDRIYLSTDTTISGDDRDLGGAQNVSYIDAGESYVAAVDVTLPRGLFGNLFLLVKTDVGNSVAEDNEANNIRAKSINVLVPPLPDLSVPFVQAPEEVFAGQSILLNWRVENHGTGGMTPQQTNWTDHVYLSQDTIFSPATDRLIASRPNTAGALAQNAGYTVNGFSATLPNNIIGDWYVFVVTDAANQIYEFTSENNNFNYDTQQPGSPMTIRATPPDLTILQPVTAPANAAAGSQIAISFTEKNQGAFDAAPPWSDKIYLSNDNTLDPSSDFDLGTFSRSAPLGAGLDYTVNANVQLPNCLAGTFYLFVVTDAGNQVFEFDPKINAETNNTSQPRPIQIASVPPDLQIVSISAPSTGTAGQTIPIGWTVVNNGAGATATGNWYDNVLLGSSPVFGNGVSVQLGSFLRSDGALAPNASYSRSENVTLPASLPGGVWYVFVTTDQTNFVQECGGENNNSLSSPTTLTAGPNPTFSNQPDLRINNISTTPANGLPGETILVQWIGINGGNQALPVSNWNDMVYFSSDAALSPSDTPIGSALISQSLPVGGTYQGQAQVTLPNGTPGNYFLIVNADSGNHVFEGDFENNNASSRSIVFEAPAVDLRISSVNVPSTAVAGQSINVSFTVENISPEITFASNWTDYAVLSRDLILDTTDRVIANFGHTGALGAGASYTVTGEAFIPSGLTGEYNVFVITDRHNQVFESNETNNAGAPAQVVLSLAPPADLVVQTINPPAAQIVPGEEATFSWTVQNAGSNPAPGSWSDSVYLSTDQTWDINDVLIGQRVQNGPLAPAASYNAALTTTLPAMNLGTYYVIVRTDTRNTVRELIESNNKLASASTTTVDVTELQVGIPRPTTFATGQERFYKVNVPAGETLLTTLIGEPGNSNELYTRFGQMVSRRQYDFLFNRPYEANQETLVPTTAAGTYYNLARADFVAARTAKQDDKEDTEGDSLAQNATIKAELLPFDIRRVSPSTAGNGGYAALTVEGAKFTPTTTVKLVRQGVELIPTNKQVETSRLAAVFDLRGKPAGAYDVVVRNPDGQTKTLPNGFTIVQGGNHDISVKVNGPGSVRPDTYGRFTVSVRNSGLNDALLTQLFIFVPANADYRLSREGEIPVDPTGLPTGMNIEDIPIDTITEDGKTIPIMIPLLKRGETLNINIDVRAFVGSTNIIVRGSIMPPMLALDGTGLLRGEGEPSVGNCLYNAIKEFFLNDMASKLTEFIGGPCAEQVADYLTEHMSLFSDLIYGGVTRQPDRIIGWETITGLTLATIRVVTVCAVANLPITRAVFLAKTIANGLYKAWQLYQQYTIARDCIQAVRKYADTLITSVVRPSDPNDKIGPSGYGALKFVAAQQVLNYRINFENMPTASAYAQRVRITDQLPNTLDARTVRLKEVGFGNYRFEVPDNRSFFQHRAQLGEDLGNLLADINAGLDIVTGRVTWTLTAIDPATGEQPLDPNSGLLPPNGSENLGQGYVIFTIQPKAPGMTGALINNNATIVFDTEPPIITNTVTNTLDAVAPSTNVAALPGSSEPVFEVQWGGGDDTNGSGLENYDIWVAENNGVYQPFISGTIETSAQFTGLFGRTYRFYSTARDNAGNIEAPPENPDAVTTVEGGAYEGDIAPRPNGTNDGTVNDDDTALTRRFAAGLEGSFLFNEIQRADSAPLSGGGNGSFSIADVIQTRRFALGLDNVVFASGPLSLGPDKLSSLSSAMAGREIRAVKQSRIGNKLLMRIELTAQGDEVGTGFTINFDPNVLSNPSNVQLGTDAVNAILTINNSDVSQGKLGILIDKAPNQPFAQGMRRILTLEFDIAPNPPQDTEISFGSLTVVTEVVDGNANPLTTGFATSNISLAGPTAAGVAIGGKVTKADGTGIGNVLLALTDQNGTVRIARTNAFGYYSFENVAAGQTYFLSARHKNYHFTNASVIVTITDARNDLDFTVQKE